MSETDVVADETVVILSDERMLPCVPVYETITFDLDELSYTNDLVLIRGADTLILNFGDAGVDYHAMATGNKYTTLPSGATAWVFDDRADYIAIPAGSSINNLQSMTLEWQFKINGSGGHNAGRLWSKQQHLDSTFDIYVDDIEDRFVITRNTIYNVDEWKTPLSSVVTAGWNNLQISWVSADSPENETAPLIINNNKVIEVEHTLVGTGPWADDSEYDAIIGNKSSSDYNINATVSLFRLRGVASGRGVCKSNYLADVWRLHDPATGALAVPSDILQNDTDPLMRIGKNLSSIDVQFDYSSIVTKLYPRGTGQTPSETRLDNPLFYPAYQELVLHSSDADWVYFRLPGEYSCYGGFQQALWLKGTGYYVGRGHGGYWTGPPKTPFVHQDSVSYKGDALAVVFHEPAAFRIAWFSFLLRHIIETPITRDFAPRFQVGLYATAPSGAHGSAHQRPGFYVPSYGPLVWNYGNLYSISSTQWDWYNFPMQTREYPAGWYACVISPYPNDQEWEKWGATKGDYLAFAGAGSRSGIRDAYATTTHTGVAPDNWNVGGLERNGGWADPFTWQVGWSHTTMATDVTHQFYMTSLGNPGRFITCRRKDYVPNTPYVYYYNHAPYLMAWDAYNKYGKIEGTYKNDALTTQDALLKGATEYLRSVSEPIVTFSVSAADLYDLDPQTNWAEELTLGGLVTVSDDVLGIEQQCVISKITKPNLNNPHDIQIQLDNVHLNAAKLLANLASAHQTMPKYLQGQTVASPYTTVSQADAAHPAQLYFEIRDVTQLTHSVKLTITPTAYQQATSTGVQNDNTLPNAFKIVVDGNAVR
jgi:hypothetical protein